MTLFIIYFKFLSLATMKFQPIHHVKAESKYMLKPNMAKKTTNNFSTIVNNV